MFSISHHMYIHLIRLCQLFQCMNTAKYHFEQHYVETDNIISGSFAVNNPEKDLDLLEI